MKKVAREGKRAGWEIERLMGIEVGEAGEDDPSDGGHYSGPEDVGEAGDGGDATVKEKCGEGADAYG